MKYIRTKYDIFKDYDIDYCDTRNPESGAVAVSENLKELCDEFVIIDKNKPFRPYIIYGVNIKNFYEINKGICEIYGAIWTDEGLIYVAKMNDKEELELL